MNNGWWGKALRGLLSLFTVAFATGAYYYGTLAGNSKSNSDQSFYIGVGVTFTAGAAVLQLISERSRRIAVRVAEDATAQLTRALQTGLNPVSRHMGELIDAGVRAHDADKNLAKGQILTSTLEAAVMGIGADSRCVYYELDAASNKLKRRDYRGRPNPPRDEFDYDPSKPGNVALIDLVKVGGEYPPTNLKDDPDIKPTPGSGYQTLAAVSVKVAGTPKGVLIVDAPKAGSLDASHQNLLRVLANLLGASIEHP
jgi:hypothetical protein